MPRFKNREDYERWRAERMGGREEDWKSGTADPKRNDLQREKPVKPPEVGERPEPPETRVKAEEPEVADWVELAESEEELKIAEDLAEPERLKYGDEFERISPPRRQSPPIFGRLRSVGELLGDSWGLYKSRFVPLLCLYLLSLVLLVAIAVTGAGIGAALAFLFPLDKKLVVAGGIGLGLIPGLIAFCWGTAALTFATLDEALSIKEALRRGWENLWAFVWIGCLLGFILTGGILLFVIPGIVFMGWFLFSPFVLAGECRRGMDALLSSKGYVEGYWFSVFLRVLVILLISFVLSMIPMIGSLLSLLFGPFVLISMKLIYDDLKALKGRRPAYAYPTGEKLKWIGAGMLGYLAFPVIVGVFMGSALTVPFLMLKEVMGS